MVRKGPHPTCIGGTPVPTGTCRGWVGFSYLQPIRPHERNPNLSFTKQHYVEASCLQWNRTDQWGNAKLCILPFTLKEVVGEGFEPSLSFEQTRVSSVPEGLTHWHKATWSHCDLQPVQFISTASMWWLHISFQIVDKGIERTKNSSLCYLSSKFTVLQLF